MTFTNFFFYRIPGNSNFLKNTEFIVDNYGQGVRTQHVMIVSENDVLTPEAMQKLAIINKEISEIQVQGEDGSIIDFEKLCLRWLCKMCTHDIQWIKICVFYIFSPSLGFL